MPDSPPFPGLDRLAIRRAFDKAAVGFDAAAALHHEVRNRLLERLSIVRGEPGIILDLGAGTGGTSRALKDRFGRAQVVAFDLSPAMLETAASKQRLFKKFSRVSGTAERLPFRDRSIDWCVSNIALAWCDPPDQAFAEVQRVLRPGGLFTFTTFGPDSLIELRQAWARVDDLPHVHRFIDMHDLGDALLRAGFAEPVMDVERIVLTYPSTDHLLREMKATGAMTALRDRPKHLGRRRALRNMVREYDAVASNGRISATAEVIYGQAWCGIEKPSSHPGEVHVSVDVLRGSRASRMSNKNKF